MSKRETLLLESFSVIRYTLAKAFGRVGKALGICVRALAGTMAHGCGVWQKVVFYKWPRMALHRLTTYMAGLAA